MNEKLTLINLEPPDVLDRVSEFRGPFLLFLDDSESSAHALDESWENIYGARRLRLAKMDNFSDVQN